MLPTSTDPRRLSLPTAHTSGLWIGTGQKSKPGAGMTPGGRGAPPAVSAGVAGTLGRACVPKRVEWHHGRAMYVVQGLGLPSQAICGVLNPCKPCASHGVRHGERPCPCCPALSGVSPSWDVRESVSGAWCVWGGLSNGLTETPRCPGDDGLV
jgi:hypothetical protein